MRTSRPAQRPPRTPKYARVVEKPGETDVFPPRGAARGRSKRDAGTSKRGAELMGGQPTQRLGKARARDQQREAVALAASRGARIHWAFFWGSWLNA